MFLRKFKKLLVNQDGVSVTEFGLISPVLIVMLLGAFDLGHGYYVKTVIAGKMEDLARDSSLEGAAVTAQQQLMDQKITDAIKNVSPNATVTVTRRFYKTFTKAAAAQAEQWTDTDGDGTCNNNEPYIDENLNDTWDADGGDDGQGGAKDVVLMKVNVTYPRMFPMAGLLGWNNDVVFLSDSILANQPYAAQDQYGTAIQRNCT